MFTNVIDVTGRIPVVVGTLAAPQKIFELAYPLRYRN
jgi:hypothetical protein